MPDPLFIPKKLKIPRVGTKSLPFAPAKLPKAIRAAQVNLKPPASPLVRYDPKFAKSQIEFAKRNATRLPKLKPKVATKTAAKIGSKKLGRVLTGAGKLLKGPPGLGTLLLLADAMEANAPGVHDWLRGGWKGTGTKLNDQLVPGELLVQGGQCEVDYYVQASARYVRGDGHQHVVSTPLTTYPGPIQSPRQYQDTAPSGNTRIWVAFNANRSPARQQFSPVEIGTGIEFASYQDIHFTALQRVDGLPDECGDQLAESTEEPNPLYEEPTEVQPEELKVPWVFPFPFGVPFPKIDDLQEQLKDKTDAAIDPTTNPYIPGTTDLPKPKNSQPVTQPIPNPTNYPVPLNPPKPEDLEGCIDPCIQEILNQLGGLKDDVRRIPSQSCNRLTDFLEDIITGTISDLISSGIQDAFDKQEEEEEEESEGQGSGGSTGVAIELEDIELPYVTCIPQPDGTLKAIETLYQLQVPRGSVPLSIRQLFFETANLAIKGCENNLIKRIYDIVGGDKWFKESNNEQPLRTINFEQELKDYKQLTYGEDFEKISAIPVTDLTEYSLAKDTIAYTRLGLDDFPGEVPEKLIYDPETEQETTVIQNQTSFHEWQLRQFDSLFGQFPIDIKVEDVDPTTGGSQEKLVSLPNIAEGIAEIFGLLIGNGISDSINLNINTRILAQLGQIATMALTTQGYAKANSEFLGFKREFQKVDLPLTFKPGESSYEKMLTEHNQKTYVLKNTDEKDLMDWIVDFSQAASIIKAVHTRNFNLNDLDKQILEYLREIKDAADDSRLPEAVKSKKQEDWSQFTEETEQGFINLPGITDSVNPYGRPFDQRPRIRSVGEDGLEDNQ
jgi:hypothetical protein